MSDTTAAEPRPSTPFPPEGGAPAAAPADPLEGDWSEGMRGPVRALDIPAPRHLGAAEAGPDAEPAAAAAAAAGAAPGTEDSVEAPDAWSVAADDPLHSVPPPPASHHEPAGSTLESALQAASTQHAEVAALLDLPAEEVVELSAAEALDSGPHDEHPVAEGAGQEPVLEAGLDEGVIELPASDALEAREGAPEPAPAAASQGESAGQHAGADAWLQAIAAHASAPVEASPWGDATAVSQSAAQASPPETPPAPADAQAAAAWESPAPSSAAAAGWDAAPAVVPAAHGEGWSAPASADWSAVAAGPDWSAPAVDVPKADDGWGAPPPLAAASAWSQAAPAAPVVDWQAPPPAAEPAARERAPVNPLLMDDPEPLPQEPKEGLFAPLAAGESLAAEPEASIVIDEDPDLPVAVEAPPRAPLAHIEPLAVGSLAVQGEHRVAVHTRGGRTLRGVVRDIDLSTSQFSLLPQGGAASEPIYHADVKAIFFMLAPGEKASPGSGGKVRVTFADGRSIDGSRDGGDGKHGFFLVPADAARTNTRRIYVAREAVTELKEG